MWWVIGFGVFLLGTILISKFRTVHRQVELTTIARNHINMSFAMLNSDVFERGTNPRVWHDPYLLGYAQGTIAMLLALFGPKLSTLRKGMVSVNTMKDLAGDQYADVSERMMRLRKSKDPVFTRGESHGADVMALIFNQAGPELLADPEVQAALREAPATAEALKGSGLYSYNGPLADAGAALMARYMVRHKVDDGY